jgi:hypothetical protein
MQIEKKITTLRWDFLGHGWKCAHRQTLNIISGLLTVKNNNEPIIPRYLMMSTLLQFSSISIFVDIHVSVSASLTCYIPNLFSRSLSRLWLMKMPSLVCLICNLMKKFNSLIMLISNLSCMYFANSLQRNSLVTPNIISLMYIVQERYLYLFSLWKRWCQSCQYWNHFNKKSL